jgi:hypothetical protein
MGHLSFQDIKTGVIFGFLKEVLSLKDEFGSDRVVFCFESGLNKRKELFPEYKLKRHSRELDETELQVLGEFKHQLKVLRQDHLPAAMSRTISSRPSLSNCPRIRTRLSSAAMATCSSCCGRMS